MFLLYKRENNRVTVALVDSPNPTICRMSYENVSRLNIIIMSPTVGARLVLLSFRHEREMYSYDPG